MGILLIGGCQTTAKTGEYFEVEKLNVIERDLTVKSVSASKKTSLTNPNLSKNVGKNTSVTGGEVNKSKKALAKPKRSSSPNKQLPSTKKIVQRSYYIYKGETYKHAISRWFNRSGYDAVAWSIGKSMEEKLNGTSPLKTTYTGSFPYVMSQLSYKLAEKDNQRFFISMDKRLKMGAVHEWQDRYVKIINVHGDTLQDTVRNLVTDYGWNWDDKQSWRSKNNFAGFAISFPIVSPVDDIGFALNQLLNNRSVRAEYHDGTRTVFINDDI